MKIFQNILAFNFNLAYNNARSQFRGIAQLVEQWSPKPRAEGSNPSAPAILMKCKLRFS